jgi:methyl coenzyme M reductase subunit C-like uncharacterized protein (methanogenesis marker protein 7)
MKTFNFISDPSHGWLKVPVTELERLGIQNQISRYSYIRKGMAYLEEDCDMAKFIRAREAENNPIVIKESYGNKMSRVRNYASYVYS